MSDQPGKKRKPLRTALLAALFAAIGIVGWYAASAMSSVFGRSTASVSGTNWESFESQFIAFGKVDDEGAGEGVWYEKSDPLAFDYRESNGYVILAFSGGSQRYMLRVGDKKLATSDGKELFYLYE